MNAFSKFKVNAQLCRDMRVREKPRPILHGFSLLTLWRQVSSGGACRGEVAA